MGTGPDRYPGAWALEPSRVGKSPATGHDVIEVACPCVAVPVWPSCDVAPGRRQALEDAMDGLLG